MKGEIISTRTVMKKIAKDRKVIPELFVEIDKRIQERINFEKNKEEIQSKISLEAARSSVEHFLCLMNAIALSFQAVNPQ